MAKIINKFGEMLGWNSVTVNMLGRDIEGISEISYTDEQQIEGAYGAGRMPVGFTTGNYTAQAKLTMYKEEAIALQNSLPPAMRIQDIPPFDIIVKYEKDGTLFKDIVHNCKFKNNGSELKQNEGKVEIGFDMWCSHISYNLK